MGILSRYIGKTIFLATLLSLFVLMGLSDIIKFVEQMGNVGQGTYNVIDALYFVLLKMPYELATFFPMAALIGVLIGLGSLASSNELVVMQAAGMSKFKIALFVLKTAIPMILVVMFITEFIAPLADKNAYSLRDEARYGEASVSNKYGQWVKDGNDYISISRINSNSKLFGIRMYFFDNQMILKSALVARKGVFKGDHWAFTHTSQTLFLGDKTQVINQNEYDWKTDLNPAKLAVILTDPAKMSMRDIYSYIKYLEHNGQDASQYWLVLWRKCCLPFTVSVMMLLSVSFVFSGLRTVTMGTRLIFGIASGFVFHVSGKLFGPLSLVFHLPAILGASLPSILVLVVALYLLRKPSG